MPPLSLYIHLPWCVQKCPYCDFNSHSLRGQYLEGDQETRYLQALIDNATAMRAQPQDRPLHSIFIGGGTPSLFSANSIAKILTAVERVLPFADDIEITLEANPGTVEQANFQGYRAAGVNRLSLGVQSFSDSHLKALGRIHGAEEARAAYTKARDCGFDNINIDIMYALPNQTADQAMSDLEQAIALAPNHISWYQLTLEPNTPFAHRPPPLPDHDQQAEISLQGQALLAKHGYQRYEISAYCQEDQVCRHNLNYWQFGDYLGIGAGAHSKLTQADGTIERWYHAKHPKQYSANPTEPVGRRAIPQAELGFEFMLNALRLETPIDVALLTERTGLTLQAIQPSLDKSAKLGLLTWDSQQIRPTQHGKLFYNETVSCFLADQ